MRFTAKNGVELQSFKLILGEEYLFYRGDQFIKGKFIKVTKKGYNFLHEKSNQCILFRHLFIPRKWQEQCQGPIKHVMVPVRYSIQRANNG